METTKITNGHIQEITFVGSFPTAPPSIDLPEIAFVGRSNVGKSSAINTYWDVTNQKCTRFTAARTNTGDQYFEIDKTFRFVN